MMNKSRRWLLALLMCSALALTVTGCDQLKKPEETESETETEAPTESETETEAPTESETETEAPTESETETETQPQTYTLDTTVDEETASLTEYSTIRVMYALDDLNVRELPGTSDECEIFYSYTSGDQISVVGETTNWYMVSIDGYESNGYVYKEYVGESADSASDTTGTDTASETTATTSETTASDTDTGSTDTSSVDLEYGVETYAESFTIVATAGANMRSEPSQDSEIIGTIASDTQVTAIGYTDRWYKISYNGTVGYVNKNLFSAN